MKDSAEEFRKKVDWIIKGTLVLSNKKGPRDRRWKKGWNDYLTGESCSSNGSSNYFKGWDMASKVCGIIFKVAEETIQDSNENAQEIINAGYFKHEEN